MKINIIKGDITIIATDAIVNAANSSLLGGGGVDGAIHRKGGNAILHECMAIRNKQGGCETGEAVITGAGNLPAKFVIHTVGPIWQGGNNNEAQLLANCYKNSLKIAHEKQMDTIAFPNISTGIYGFPKALEVQIAANAVTDFFNTERGTVIKEISFVCFDEENFQLYNDKFFEGFFQ